MDTKPCFEEEAKEIQKWPIAAHQTYTEKLLPWLMLQWNKILDIKYIL